MQIFLDMLKRVEKERRWDVSGMASGTIVNISV